MNIKTKIFTLILLLFNIGLKGQQLPIYSQYVMNKFLLNPAVAGYDGYTSVNLTARDQWLGFVNSPRTFAISGQTRLLGDVRILRGRRVKKNPEKAAWMKGIGLGGCLHNDRNGIINRTGLQFTYAYHINLNNESQLSLGLAGTCFQFTIDEGDAVLTDTDDPLLNGMKRVFFVPDANFGVYIANDILYAGLSVSQLFGSYVKMGKMKYSNYRMLRHYYLTAGCRFYFENDFKVEPSILIKTTKNNLQVDISSKFYYRDDYWGGISYRTNSALIFMTGIKVNKFYFGYAFDVTLSNIKKYSSGSHEIIIGSKFGEDNIRRKRWLRKDVKVYGD